MLAVRSATRSRVSAVAAAATVTAAARGVTTASSPCPRCRGWTRQAAHRVTFPSLAPVRFFSSSRAIPSQCNPFTAPLSSLRNLCIIAHVDAGKTTLTERLLHLTHSLTPPASASDTPSSSGATPGDVDSGSTVTDFLEAERRRGITIQSAAVGPIWWPPPAASPSRNTLQPIGISLVDTPGHVDFSIEVERSLRVVDGAVIVLDAVEGVEAQTEGVWRIADRYGVSSQLLFINKLDRPGASVSRSLHSVMARGLHPHPLLLQLPLPASGGATLDDQGLAGVIDLLTLETLTFGGRAGELVKRLPLDAAHPLHAEAVRARYSLVETLASLDDVLLEALLSSSAADAHAALSPPEIRAAIRRQTLANTVVPAFCGAAARNIGVQPLLDGIRDYLASPQDRGVVEGRVDRAVSPPTSPSRRAKKGSAVAEAAPSENTALSIRVDDTALCALAFKVTHTPRGPLTFVRVYSGVLHARTSALLNTSSGARERLTRCMLAYADQFVDVPALRAGQIGVLIGLRDTRTGDTLVDAKGSAAGGGMGADARAWKTLRLRQVHVPPPVFSMSVEPLTRADEAPVAAALDMLVRTDPSLRLDDGSASDDAAGPAGGALGAAGTGQTVLSGMGELHLEIARDRLRDEFGVRARLGAVRVAFRETVGAQEPRADEAPLETTVSETLERDMAGARVRASCEVTVRALREGEEAQSGAGVLVGGNVLVVDTSPGDEAPPPEQDDDEADTARRNALLSGLRATLSRGPLSSEPLSGLHVTLRSPTLHPPDGPARALSAVAALALRRAVSAAGPRIMEPVMRMRVEFAAHHLGSVVADLAALQGAAVLDVGMQGAGDGEAGAHTKDKVVDVYLPPDELDPASAHPAAEGERSTSTLSARVPLAQLVGYAARLRALTAGAGAFTMHLDGFSRVGDERQREVLRGLGRG